MTFPKKRTLRMAGFVFGGSLFLLVGFHFALRLVSIPSVLFQPGPASVQLTDRHGTPLRDVRVNEHFARETALRDVPPTLVHAMLAAEDKRFFEHGGVDLLAIARAIGGNLFHHHVRSGASTITEQLVKIVHPRPRTMRTKVLEALTALRLEQIWSKQQILEAYLNRIDFGNLNYGIAAAADYYFGKPLSDLTEAEAALIAGLPKNPARLNPHRAFGYAKRRQELVLRRMRDDRWISAATCARAIAEPLLLQPPRRIFQAPHFVDLVLQNATSKIGTIATSLDLDVQHGAERAVRDRLAPLRKENVHHAAAVVIDNATGGVLALVGSDDYFAPATGQVNGAWARRSPGSALKPFTYLIAFERGATAATVAADVPAEFITSTGSYRPQDFSQRCLGPVRYRLALANSLNIPAVRVLATLGGPAPLRDRLVEWGITTLARSADEYGLGLTIGNAEVRLLELTNAYAALARLGRYEPYKLGDASGLTSTKPAHEAPPPPALQAWLIADILSDNEARVHSFGRESALRYEFPVACKTGTSTDFRDNWAMGYTPDFTVGVWVGNFDGSPMKDVSGVTGAAPILHDIFEHLHARFGTTWYQRPPEIVDRTIHPITGKITGSGRADAIRESFIAGTLPPSESPGDYDTQGRAILGAEYQEWISSNQNNLAEQIAPPSLRDSLRLVTPAPGTTFVIDPDIPSTSRIPLLARGRGVLTWKSDTLKCAQEGNRSFADAVEGSHRLQVRDDATGQTVETWVSVKRL